MTKLKQLALLLSCTIQCACIPAMVPKSPGAFGRVTDARSHAPIAHAKVSFPDLNAPVAFTDNEGRFDIPYEMKLGIVVLLPFEFQNSQLQVLHPGYRPFSKRVFFACPHEYHDITLQPEK